MPTVKLATKLIVFIGILLSGIFGANQVLAFIEEPLKGNLIVDVSPPYPRNEESVLIGLNSYELDLNTANVEWKIDGEIYKSEIGLKKIELGPRQNDRTIITITASDNFGKKVIKRITLDNSSVDVLLEAQVYVPPFYRGHSLPTAGSKVKAVALPEIKKISGERYSAKELIYKWKSGSDYYRNSSGVGKNYFFFTQPNESDFTLTLEADTPDKKIIIEKETLSVTVSPRLIFYQVKPLEGNNYGRSLSDGNLISDSEATIIAEPYYFSLQSILDGLKFTWAVNEEIVTGGESSSRLLTINREDRGAQHATIQVQALDSKNLTQQALASVKLEF